MKLHAFIGTWIAFSLMTVAHAQTRQEFRFDGSTNQTTLQLLGTEGRTIYETRQEPYTCYRREQQGYQEICENLPRQHCYDRYQCDWVNDRVCSYDPYLRRTVCRDRPHQRCYNRRYCETRYERVCRSEPRYVDVPYTCTREVQVPIGFETTYNVTAKVNLTFDHTAGVAVPNEVFEAKLENGRLELRERLSNRYLVSAEQNQSSTLVKEKEGATPGEKLIELHYRARLVPIEEAIAPAKGAIMDVRLSTEMVSFNVNRVSLPDFFKARLYIGREQFMVGDLVRYNDELPLGSYDLRDIGGGMTQVVVDLRRLNVEVFRDAKYKVRIEVGVVNRNTGARVINPGALPIALKREFSKGGMRPE